MKILKKILLNITLFFNSLFYGMKAGNALLTQKENKTGDDSDIVGEKAVDDVFGDFIRGEETQRVKETRDEMYQTLRESEKIAIDRKDIDYGAEGIMLHTRKKTAADYSLKVEVYNPENLPVRLLQDNRFYEIGSSFFIEDIIEAQNTGKKYVSIFNIKRNDFLPRFKLEDYINRLVVRTIDNEHVYLDMYTTAYASQFGKIDALFVKQIYDIKKNGNKKSDITDISELSFVTDKSAGELSLYKFHYDNIQFKDVNVFDGNFVLTFTANVKVNGEFVGDKYKTNELDEKLKKHAQRDNVTAVDAETLLRHIKQEENNEIPDYGTVTFKFKDENSN